ncbi:hypothetical protein FQA39_LY11628 [Lamprigera yunnana]|nr:hypothetical protein FQA39_LY11628 [Lamprigera yunnana]
MSLKLRNKSLLDHSSRHVRRLINANAREDCEMAIKHQNEATVSSKKPCSKVKCDYILNNLEMLNNYNQTSTINGSSKVTTDELHEDSLKQSYVHSVKFTEESNHCHNSPEPDFICNDIFDNLPRASLLHLMKVKYVHDKDPFLFLNFLTNFKTKLLQQFSAIKVNLIKLNRRISLLENSKENVSKEDINENETSKQYEEFISNIFPLQNEGDLVVVEVKLEEELGFKVKLRTRDNQEDNETGHALLTNVLYDTFTYAVLIHYIQYTNQNMVLNYFLENTVIFITYVGTATEHYCWQVVEKIQSNGAEWGRPIKKFCVTITAFTQM